MIGLVPLAVVNKRQISSALMDDLERIPVRIKHVSGVVSRIVFDSRPR
jgi:hypothetical protein